MHNSFTTLIRTRKLITRSGLILSLFVFLTIAQRITAQGSPGSAIAPTEIRIDAGSVLHTMAGGAGASWHAMGPEAYWYKNLTGKDNRNTRGSGWGGNPPLDYADAWNDLRTHARWLGLNFIRVEIDMRMYEPERGKFDWQNDQMQTLYRILDFCQENNIDVFLTQMWADVDWNTYEGMNRLQSAPRSVDDFAQGLATLTEYLVKTKHNSVIRWLCIVNEPGGPWDWWQATGNKPVSLMPALHAVRAELDKRGIAVGLSGPDWSAMSHDTPDFDFNDNVVAALDAHNYSYSPNATLQRLWVEKAHSKGIPFFQSEFGTYTGGDPFGDRTAASPKSYPNQLVNAEKVIKGMNSGVDGFNRWSFTNRGDLDGQWQLVRTFDADRWDYYKRVTPEPVPYFTYGILTRFMAKHSAVLETSNPNAELDAATIQSPKGNLTVYVLNTSEGAQSIKLNFSHLKSHQTLYKYQVSESAVNDPHFEMNPIKEFEVTSADSTVSDKVPGFSITVYSTYKLINSDPGIIAE